MSKINSFLDKSKGYLKDPIAFVTNDKDPTTAGEKLLVRQINIVILILEDMLSRLERIEGSSDRSSLAIEALDLVKLKRKKVENIVKPYKLWDPNEVFGWGKHQKKD